MSDIICYNKKVKLSFSTAIYIQTNILFYVLIVSWQQFYLIHRLIIKLFFPTKNFGQRNVYVWTISSIRLSLIICSFQYKSCRVIGGVSRSFLSFLWHTEHHTSKAEIDKLGIILPIIRTERMKCNLELSEMVMVQTLSRQQMHY